MSDAPKSPEQRRRDRVAAGLNGILAPLDSSLGHSNSLGCLSLVLAPVVFGVMYAGLDLAVGWSLLAGGVAFAAVLVWSITWDDRVIRKAVSTFHRRFPPGSEDRDVAVPLLPQLAFPNKAHLKVAEALGGGVVVATAPEQQLAQGLQTAVGEVPATLPAPAPATPAAPLQAPPQRERFIPLEPFAPAEPGPETGRTKGGSEPQ